MLVYVTEPGGRYAWKVSSDEEYEAAVRDGQLSYIPADIDRPTEADRVVIPVVFVALVRVERNHDFDGGGPRAGWADLAEPVKH
jgi:hypothetical protein